MEFLVLENLEKKYSEKGPMIVKKANLSVDKGEFVVFLGPSGCGKTTIIRMIAGLEDVTGGDIKLDGRSIVGELPKNRGVSMIFQSYAVWPHMTVHDNIAYPLKLKKLPKAEIERIVEEMGRTCELTDYMKRYPSQLSGGQRQRVAVARAIAVKPKLFLMDEPLSNLDAKLRVSMRTELKRIHEQIGATSIFVTHDQSEAMSLADKIVVLNNGKIEQVGTPYEVYHKSETMFVASFIGAPPTNFFDAEIVRGEKGTVARTASFDLPLKEENAAIVQRYEGKTVKLGIRPEKFFVRTKKTARAVASVKVEFAEPQGSYVILITRMGDTEVKISTDDTTIRPGDEIYIELDDDDAGFFDPDTGRRIKRDPVYDYLTELYPGRAREVYDRIAALKDKYRTDEVRGERRFTERDAFLITYGDTLTAEGEKPLATMTKFAGKYLKNVVNTVHLLPIYPYTSDDGFSVLDYRKVDERLGDWADVDKLGKSFGVMLDAVFNHVSAGSVYVRGYLDGDPKYADFFIDADPKADYSMVTRPRTTPLLTEFTAKDGTVRHLWTTFSADQVDFNLKNPEVLLELLDILLFYASHGASFIRLDAIGLLWKKQGTRCMHLPETHKLIKIMRSVLADCSDARIITETNVPHEDNISYFGNGSDEASMVYQFPLPPLTLYSMLSGDASKLTEWAGRLETEMPGRAYFNFLSSHDGIGVRPVEKVLNDKELQLMIDHTLKTGGRVGYRTMPDGSEKPYELNVNYLSAVTEPDDDADTKTRKFMAAQSIALSLLGVPAIYIHSLLGSENDVSGMEESGINRRINRQKLSLDAVSRELNDASTLRHKVYAALSALLKIRAANKAFSPMGSQRVLNLDSRVFAVERTYADARVVCAVNVSDKPVDVELPGAGSDLVTGEAIDGKVTLQPYRFVWLKCK